MEDLIIVAGIAVGLFLLKKHLDAVSAGASTTIPTALGLSTAPTTSAGYQVTAGGTMIVQGYPSSPSSSGTVPAPAPVQPPPPPFFGGTVGGVGSGGNPLGGSLRAGVSSGTGTTAPGGTTMYNFQTGQTSYRAPTASVLPADTSLAGTRATLAVGHR
jgi:hypothetical protein